MSVAGSALVAVREVSQLTTSASVIRTACVSWVLLCWTTWQRPGCGSCLFWAGPAIGARRRQVSAVNRDRTTVANSSWAADIPPRAAV
ncbi:hypothetical protein ADK76_27200 [Streptomyces griseoflavus]|nr:hypothetical protein ADK76_27200 [Streptomyces griseoflavus]